MEPMTLILTALGAGGVALAKGALGQAGKELYEKLRDKISGKFVTKPEGKVALEQFTQKPVVWSEPLKDSLAATEADKDSELLTFAQQLLDVIRGESGGDQTISNTMTAIGKNIAQASHGGIATVNVNRDKDE